jgi:hypothetical protein
MPIRAGPSRQISNEPLRPEDQVLVDPCYDRSIDGDSLRVIQNLITAQAIDIDADYFQNVQGKIKKTTNFNEIVFTK